MSKINRHCALCGAGYYFCPTCNDANAQMKSSWYNLYDTENCKNIFDILVDNFLQKDTKEISTEKLKACDLTNIDTFDVDIQEQIRAIIS